MSDTLTDRYESGGSRPSYTALDAARNELDALRLAASRCLDDIRSRLFELKCEIDARDSDVAYAMDQYAGDMMNDFVSDREAEITNEITDLEDRLGDGA